MKLSAGTARSGAELIEFEHAIAEAADHLAETVDNATELAEGVIDRAQSIASRLGSPQAVRAAATLTRSRSAELGVELANSDDVPYAVGAEWGAQHDVPRDTSRGTVAGWNQLPEATSDGWFLQPAAGAVLDDDDLLEQLLGPAVDELLAHAFPD